MNILPSHIRYPPGAIWPTYARIVPIGLPAGPEFNVISAPRVSSPIVIEDPSIFK